MIIDKYTKFLYVLIVLFFLPASVLAEPSTKRGTIPTESISHCSQGGTTIIECVEAVIDSYASVVKYREAAEPHKWTLVHSTRQPHVHDGGITERMDMVEQNVASLQREKISRYGRTYKIIQRLHDNYCANIRIYSKKVGPYCR